MQKNYIIRHYGIVVSKKDPFDTLKIIESGQVFRYEKNADEYRIFSAGMMCRIREEDAHTVILTENAPYFTRYFDLEASYRRLENTLLTFGPKLRAAVEYGRGIRILRQDAFETLISFILSSNNNIPRIQRILRSLCRQIGKACAGYTAFPAACDMARQNEQFYRDIGCGYRAPWLRDAARACVDGKINLESLESLPTPALCKTLRQLQGVGPKVADCIALFAYHRFDVVPVDTWVKKIYEDFFHASAPAPQIRRTFLAHFGDAAGLAQQYLFYYYRQRGA